MTLTLYTNPMSRGRIAHWLMEEAGQPYELIYLTYPEMAGPDYLAINPMGKVPALIHNGHVVTEYAAICAHMADAFPQAGLKPVETSAYYRWLFFGAGPVESAVIMKNLGFDVPEAARRGVGFRGLEQTEEVLEGWLEGHAYLAGDSFSAADVATGSQILWGMQFGAISARPAFKDYAARLTARPAYRRAKDRDDAAFAAAKAAQDG